MIKDIERCRKVEFGHGSAVVGTAVNIPAIVIVESSKGRVGESCTRYSGESVREIPQKSVYLDFCGKDSIRSIDMLIEYLTIIKQRLEDTKNLTPSQ